jgi:hypothetical protein
LSLLLDLVVVALDDWTGDGPDLIPLGDVLGFGRILAILVEPVL